MVRNASKKLEPAPPTVPLTRVALTFLYPRPLSLTVPPVGSHWFESARYLTVRQIFPSQMVMVSFGIHREVEEFLVARNS